MKLVRCVVLLLGATVFSAPPAYACECLPSRNPREELKVSKAVFVGEVLEVGVGGSDELVKFRVERTWKGAREEFIVISSGRGLCSKFFKAGEKWLVYALEESGELMTDTCMRTKRLAEAGADIKALGKSKAVKTRPSKRAS